MHSPLTAGLPYRMEEEAAFKAFAAQPNLHEQIFSKVAPNIFGHADIKKAVACLLFGGARKVHSCLLSSRLREGSWHCSEDVPSCKPVHCCTMLTPCVHIKSHFVGIIQRMQMKLIGEIRACCWSLHHNMVQATALPCHHLANPLTISDNMQHPPVHVCLTHEAMHLVASCLGVAHT